MDINNQVENNISELKTLLAKIFNKIMYRNTLDGVINYPVAGDFMLLIETVDSSKQVGFIYSKDGLLERLLDGVERIFLPQEFECVNSVVSINDNAKKSYLERLENCKNYLRFIYILLKKETKYSPKDLAIMLNKQANKYKIDFDTSRFDSLIS